MLCEICGNEFVPKRPHQRFCGPKCSDVFWKPKRPREEKKCANPLCNKTFLGTKKDRYCCIDCRVAVNNEKMRKFMRKPEERFKCLWCGKTVYTRIANPFCCTNHKRLWLQKNNIEKEK